MTEVEEVYRYLAIPVVVEVAMEDSLYFYGGLQLRGLAPIEFLPLLKSSVDWIYPHPYFGVYYSLCVALALLSVFV